MASPRRDNTEVSEATRRAKDDEARVAHRPDRAPTSDEERRADRRRADRRAEGRAEREVAQHHREMTELGAEEKGEGRIS